MQLQDHYVIDLKGWFFKVACSWRAGPTDFGTAGKANISKDAIWGNSVCDRKRLRAHDKNC